MAKKHYVDNKRFEELILKYLENQKEHEEELMEMFDKLISNIIDSFDKDSGKFVVVGWDFAKSLDLDTLDNDGDHPLNSKDLDTFYKFVGPIN